MVFRGLTGRRVVVTGASGALGAAVVSLLARGGAACHLPVRSRPDGLAPAGTAGLHVAEGVDLVDEAAVAAFYAGLPPIWASIHCAGGFAMGPIDGAPTAALDAMWAVNAKTAYLCCRHAVRRMGPDGGRIVNVAARPALDPAGAAGMVAYAMSKAAVVALTRALAAEVAGRAILVNAVAPAVIDTPANRRAMPDADASRWPTPEQVAAVIAGLAAPDNAAITGAVVPVYGRA